VLVVANGAAGARRGPAIGECVTAELRRAGFAAELLLTRGRGHGTELAASALARGTQRIIACGGDGTVQEVVRALAGTAALLGIVPCGRGNDFARVLGIPKDPVAAARIAGSGHTRRIDLGRVRAFGAGGAGDAPSPFTTVAAVGFDSEAAAFVHRSRLRLPGPFAYLVAVARTLVTYSSPEVRIEGDFGEFAGRVLLVATGNTTTYGGGMKIVPAAVWDDGFLDLCIVRAIPRRTLLPAFPRIFAGTHVELPFVETRRARRVRIEASRPLWVFADGEPVGKTPAEITIEPLALSVLVPA
jgi:YegS/Rv2252/BmrU family lipid kinase